MADGASPNRDFRHGSIRGLGLPAAARLLEFLETPVVVPPEGDGLPQIAGYVIEEVAGSGGGGTVYRARREGGSDREVALKVLSLALGDPAHSKAAQRAWRELDVLSDLHLPCLPRVLDHGTHEGRLFIVTDWIDGLPLDKHCEAKGLDRRARVGLLAEVADAVQMLHEHAVIHRDLKPSNILVDSHGRPMIVDFGLAALLAEGIDPVQTLSMEGSPLGTPAFMSPEQARGERVGRGTGLPARGSGVNRGDEPITDAQEHKNGSAPDSSRGVSTRSDVYSLGATAYLILTGHTPHDMNVSLHEAVRRVSMEPAREARTLDRTLPKALGAVLGKACAARADARYVSAAELADDLRRWLANRAVLATRPSLWRRSVEWSARHPIAVTAAVCAVIAIVSMCATFTSVWWVNQRPYAVRLDGFGGPGARLVARSGNILHEWKASREQGVTFGALAESPRSHGASRIAILGNGIQPGLCAFDADHPDRLLWSSGSDLEHFRVPALPTSSGVAVHSPFFVQFGLLVDIFPDSPGSEVLAIHNDKLGDGAVIRIYNLEGTVLYEAWHSGFLYSAYWMTEPGLLVLAGVNSQALWRDRGHPEVHAVAWPAVVMAIRPVRGEKRGWITTPTLAGEFSPEWYRCVLPPGAVSEEKVALRAPDAGMGDPERNVCLGLNTDSVGLFLDGAGRMQRKPLVMATRRQSPGDGPSDSLVEQITLGDLPPIIRTVPGSPPPKGK